MIWNHCVCVAEAETEAALDIAGDEVHAWSYYNEIPYRLIILRKSLLFNILSKHLTNYSSQEHCHVEFLIKLFDKMLKKTDTF
jgi:hypothetical protein